MGLSSFFEESNIAFLPMNKPKRECGSCQFWTKWVNDGRGLCELTDRAGKAEHGKGCPDWKGKKYDRKVFKNLPI